MEGRKPAFVYSWYCQITQLKNPTPTSSLFTKPCSNWSLFKLIITDQKLIKLK